MTAATTGGGHDRLLADLGAGKKAALARVVSIVENHRDGFDRLLAALHPRIGVHAGDRVFRHVAVATKQLQASSTTRHRVAIGAESRACPPGQWTKR